MLELEQALANELASEERAIAFSTGRSRAISLVGELLYHRQLEHKALLTPEQDLMRKIGEFGRGISRFESEKANAVGPHGGGSPSIAGRGRRR